MKKKRPSESYDINNLVVPVMANHQIVITTIKYKEIYTPTWRSSYDSDDEMDEPAPTISGGSDGEVHPLISLLVFDLISHAFRLSSSLLHSGYL